MQNDLKLIEVEWVDSCQGDGWAAEMHVAGAAQVLTCYTAGYLVSENEEQITLASSVGLELPMAPRQVCSPMTIPKVAVVRRKVLKQCLKK